VALTNWIEDDAATNGKNAAQGMDVSGDAEVDASGSLSKKSPSRKLKKGVSMKAIRANGWIDESEPRGSASSKPHADKVIALGMRTFFLAFK
jgi:hypothetical protein